MPRYNITMPEELWDRIGDSAPAGNRSYFIREACERALPSEETPEQAAKRRSGGVYTGAEVVADAEAAAKRYAASARRCESCGNPVGSPTLKRCSCGGRIVPPPS